jgi:hypothetical protein
MKYIIRESRLMEIFKNFMDLQYGLKYNGDTREFISNDEEVFGYLMNNHFYYGDYSKEYLLNEMFGETTNELLFHYLKEEFPKIKINGIE